MLYCEKSKCIYFSWKRDPVYGDYEVGYRWCEKQSKELGLLDCEWLPSYECPLALPQEEQRIQGEASL